MSIHQCAAAEQTRWDRLNGRGRGLGRGWRVISRSLSVPPAPDPDPPSGEELEFGLDALVRNHLPALLMRATLLTRRSSDAWDLVQDTLERALRRGISEIRPERRRGWLLVVMQNLHLDQCRAARKRTLIELDEDSMAAHSEEEDQHQTWESIAHADVQTCVERLDPRLRAAYRLHACEGLPLAIVAQRLGVPVATAGTRVFRARRRLRELLQSPRES